MVHLVRSMYANLSVKTNISCPLIRRCTQTYTDNFKKFCVCTKSRTPKKISQKNVMKAGDNTGYF